MSKKNRIKLKLSTLRTREDAESAMNDLALVMANQRQLAAQCDAERLAIEEKYAGNFSAYAESIEALTEQLRGWAESHPDQFPKDRKSIVLTSGTVGFRTGTPSLKLASRSYTWEMVLGVLKTLRMVPNFVRTKIEVDKDALLAAHANAKDKAAFTEQLRTWGLKVVQDESFFIEPDLAQFEKRITTEAA